MFRRKPATALVEDAGTPDLPRGFRVPGYPVVPVLSVAFCAYLIHGLPGVTWALFAVLLAIAAVVYVTYARTHSTLRTTAGEHAGPETPGRT